MEFQNSSRSEAKRISSPPKESAVRTVARSSNAITVDVLDILDAVPFYVLLVDADHYILEANSAVQTQLGVKREDILGKYCPLVIHGLKHPFPGCPLEEAAEENRAIERELFDSKSGRWLRSAIYPTRALTRNGKKIFLHMVTDITERKRAEEQLRIAHKQLRSLSAHLESVMEEEKRKIARDLHDETSQVLASLSAHLEAAIGTLPAEADKTRAILRKAQTLSVMVLDELHKLIYELRPSLLDELGLVAAIGSLIDSHLKAAGVKVRFRATGAVKRLPASLEIALFRVIQEAFNNIVKHAHADNTHIVMHFKKDSVTIRIKDDGVGFDVQEAISSKNRPHGLGLLGMRERIELMNGSLVIDSSPGHGTKITIEIPLTGEIDDG
jgi:PAS domain S-box-containing protein